MKGLSPTHHRLSRRRRRRRPSTSIKRIMKKRTDINDLNFDVLRHIICAVAKSSNRAADFVRAKSVCKAFMELAEDTNILKAVAFENEGISRFDRSFWQINSLLSKCARAGNATACILVLGELEERLESSTAKMRAFELIKENYLKKLGAAEVVSTRARTKAVELAFKDVMTIILSVKTDLQEMWKLLDSVKIGVNLCKNKSNN